MDSGLILLNYHDIKTDVGFSFDSIYAIPTEKFEEQLIALMHFFKSKEVSPDKIINTSSPSLLITFDDGYASHFHIVRPLLDKYQIKAIFFPLFSKINTKGFLTENEITQLKNEGHYIGLHGWQHVPLTHYSIEKLDSALNESLYKFKELTGEECKYYSLPFGEYNERIIFALKSKGIKYIFTTNGYRNEISSPHLLNRINIRNDISKRQFQHIISSDGFTSRIIEFKGAANRIRKTTLSILKRKII